jgi:hypothetical protein
MAKPFYYGGQAVIEGVMMRGRRSMAVAVRRPNGEVVLSNKPLAALYRSSAREKPFIRGIIVLAEALVMGTQVLLYSADVSLEEEETEISGPMVWGMLTITFALALGLFLIVPLLLTQLLDIASPLISNLVDGVIRIGVFILYLAGINLMPDIRRVWAYHGAEHKTVNAYEDGVPLEVEHVKKYSTAHTRCGTGFILIVLVLAIIIFAFLGWPVLWLRILSRIALIPVIAAVGYEITRLGANYADNKIVHAILTPGLALQSMTTREPDNGQIEIAISALKRVIEDDESEES